MTLSYLLLWLSLGLTGARLGFIWGQYRGRKEGVWLGRMHERIDAMERKLKTPV